MSTRQTVTIQSPEDRQKIAVWARNVEPGTVVTFRKKSRSTEQNAKLHAMLGEVAKQVEWHGQFLDPEDWKDMFTASLRHARVVPGIDKGTYVPLGMHTSTLTIEEMSNLIELIYAFGAERGVTFKEPKQDNTNSGEAPLPEPDTADDTSTLADQAADGEGETTASPSAAALTGVQRTSMIECCRKMLAIPAQTDLDQSQKLIVLAEAKDDWKSMTKPAVHENIKGFYESAKAQIKADPRVYPNLRAKAFDLFSEVLDCEAKELGA